MFELGEIGALIAGALALALIAIVLVLALALVGTRSLFVGALCCMTLAAAACAALAASGAGPASIAMASYGGALLPIFLLGAVTLSSNSAKVHGGNRWLSVLMACAAGALIVLVLPELSAAADAPRQDPPGLAALLAAMAFVAAVAVAGLIGLGERGALTGKLEREDAR